MSTPASSLGRPQGLDREGLGQYRQEGTGHQQPGTVHSQTPDLTSPAARIAENEERVARNVLRQGRRDAGETDVEEDEQMLELVPVPPELAPGGENAQENTEGGGAGPGLPPVDAANPAVQAFMAALQQEGEMKDKAMDLLQAMFVDKSKASRKRGRLTEATDVTPDAGGYRRYRVDHRLIDLVELGFHLPLTLCTNEAIEAVRLDPARLTVKNLHDADRQKVSVVDVSVGWPDEFSLCSEDWRDAWTNFL